MSHSNLKTIAAKKKRKLESQDYVNFRCLQCKNEVFLISSWVRVAVFCSKCKLEMQKLPMKQDNSLLFPKKLTRRHPKHEIELFHDEPKRKWTHQSSKVRLSVDRLVRQEKKKNKEKKLFLEKKKAFLLENKRIREEKRKIKHKLIKIN